MFLIHCLGWPLPLFKTQHWVVACNCNFDPSERTIINTEQYIQRFRSSGMWGCTIGLTREEGTCSFKEMGTAHLRTQQHIQESPDYLQSVRTWNIVTLNLLTSKRQSVMNQILNKTTNFIINEETCLEDISIVLILTHTHTHTHIMKELSPNKVKTYNISNTPTNIWKTL